MNWKSIFGIKGFLAFSIVSALSAIVSLCIWSHLYYIALNKELALSPTSKSFTPWHETPFPMYVNMYLFNFTNTAAVAANHSIKPRFEEIGPYVFREHDVKMNLTWNNNATVRYFMDRTWYYEPDKSNGSLHDNITNVNVILSTLGLTLKMETIDCINRVNKLLVANKQNIFITKTAGELLFNGYDDFILDLMKNKTNICDTSDAKPANISSSKLKMPYIMDKFGWFYKRNGSITFDGEFNMFTGTDDINKLGLVDTWNRRHNTHAYGKGCDNVTGSMGELWPPGKNTENITIFMSDICAPMSFNKGEDTIEVNGIPGTLFVGDDSVFDNGWNYPEKACFCPTDRKYCMPAGALNVSHCFMGSPSFLSFPHFYLADKSYITNIEGMHPDKDKHEFRYALEQTIGIPLLVKAQMQVNILVQHLQGLNVINDLMPELMVPMFWFKQEVSLSEEYAKQFKYILFLKFGGYVFLSVILLSSICGVITGIYLVYKKRIMRVGERETLIGNEVGEAETDD